MAKKNKEDELAEKAVDDVLKRMSPKKRAKLRRDALDARGKAMLALADETGMFIQTENPDMVLGEVYRDLVSGFIGIATTRNVMFNRCVRITLEATATATDLGAGVYIDEDQLIRVRTGEKVRNYAPERTGVPTAATGSVRERIR